MKCFCNETSYILCSHLGFHHYHHHHWLKRLRDKNPNHRFRFSGGFLGRFAFARGRSWAWHTLTNTFLKARILYII
jgi:hypothetical protein